MKETIPPDPLMEVIRESEEWIGFSALFQALRTPDFARRNAALVMAHPGDETIAVGGHLAALSGMILVHTTDGIARDTTPDPQLVMQSSHLIRRIVRAAGRRRELESALRHGRFAPGTVLPLGLAAGDSPRRMAEIAKTLAAVFRGQMTKLVLTHAYEGGDADHDVACLAVHAACRMIAREECAAPTIIEMPFYHAAATGIAAQRFAADPNVPDIVLPLDDEAWETKQRMIACFPTRQSEFSVFRSQVERFRQAPDYDFTRPPNGGRVLYDAISAAEWVSLARDALHELGLPNAAAPPYAASGKTDAQSPYPTG